MTQREDSGDNNYAERPHAGPGRALRDGRLRCEKTPEQIADALHLNRRTIEALEADDYDNLPPLTFVRGYIRAYCQFLEMDPDPLVARLSDAGAGGGSQPLRAHAGDNAPASRPGRPARPAGRGTGFMGVALSLAALIAALVAGGWWLSRSDISLPMFRAAPDEESAPQSGPEDVVDQETRLEPEPVPETEPEPEPEPLPESEQVEQEPTLENGNEGESGDDAVPDTANPPEPPSLDNAAIADAVLQDSSPPDTGPSAEALVFRFSGESWMEVTDAGGERLLFGIADSGEQRLEGEPPFEIVIGNTDNVRLEFEGDPINLAEYERGKVARFTLGGNGE